MSNRKPWWQGRQHSTDDLEVPELEPVDNSLTAFLAMAERLYGYNREKVREIMALYGITKYDPASWMVYGIMLRTYHVDEEEHREYPAGHKCPVCGADIARRPDRDRMFGTWWGWECQAEKRHYFDAAIQRLLKRRNASITT